MAALAIPGVRKVFAVPSGVAVVAERYWAAKQGRDVLAVQWDEGTNANFSSEELRVQYRELAKQPGKLAREVGDAAYALANAAKKLAGATPLLSRPNPAAAASKPAP